MTTIATNLLHKASAQLTATDYNSMFNFNGECIALSTDGMFKICSGSVDDYGELSANMLLSYDITVEHNGIVTGDGVSISSPDGYYNLIFDSPIPFVEGETYRVGLYGYGTIDIATELGGDVTTLTFPTPPPPIPYPQYVTMDFVATADTDGIYATVTDGDDSVTVSINDIKHYVSDYIAASFKIGSTNLGISNPKRVRFAYLGYESDGDITLSMEVDEGTSESFSVESTKSGQQRARVPINRKKQGEFWEVKVANVNGSDFGIDIIELLVVELNQGFQRTF